MKIPLKIPLFLRFFMALFLVGVIPSLLFYFFVIPTYQSLLQKYTPYIESAAPELITETALTYKNITIQAGLTLVLIIILVLFANTLLTQKVISPIKKLVAATREVAKGKLGVRADIKTSDEIGELANSFNQMTEELEKTQESLKETANVLEVKVKARTKELEEEKASLEGKVRQRTKELQEKLEELEKFHRLAVGRELKMIELKKEIEKLKTKLKE